MSSIVVDDTLDFGANESAYQWVSDVIGVTFMLSMVIAVYIAFAKTPEDQFVRRALKFLILALSTRLLMGAQVYITGGVYEPIGSTSGGTQTVPWQQVYFELPFYMFLIVPMSMLFSWKLAYSKIFEFVTVDADEIPRSCSAESLDRDSFKSSNMEPLLENPIKSHPDA